MSKLSVRANLDPETTRWYREIANQVNGLSEGSIVATYNANTAAPTTGTWAKGDQIRKSDPVEAGTTPNKYVITGYLCSVAGTPGTWLELRSLTGN